MPPGKPSYSRSGRPVKAQKSEAGLMAKNPGYTHPMKEDVKKKDFSPPLGEMRVW